MHMKIYKKTYKDPALQTMAIISSKECSLSLQMPPRNALPITLSKSMAVKRCKRQNSGRISRWSSANF